MPGALVGGAVQDGAVLRVGDGLEGGDDGKSGFWSDAHALGQGAPFSGRVCLVVNGPAGTVGPVGVIGRAEVVATEELECLALVYGDKAAAGGAQDIVGLAVMVPDRPGADVVADDGVDVGL